MISFNSGALDYLHCKPLVVFADVSEQELLF